MPTYDYVCRQCGHEFEQSQSITAQPLRTCPACGKRALQRLIGTGGGIIFKGSGFYQTDYRSESYQKAAEAEKKAAAPTPAGDAATSSGKPAEKTGRSKKKETVGTGSKSKRE